MAVNMHIHGYKRTQKHTTLESRLIQIKRARKAIMTIYVNGQVLNRVEFNKIGRRVRSKYGNVRYFKPEFTHDFFSQLLSDFAEFASRLGFESHTVTGDILTADTRIAQTNLEQIVAKAYDTRGNVIHFCYNVDGLR